MGSRAQELALFVVYWSPLTCVTDDPVNYKDQPGLDFLRVVPTVWDETRVLDGAVGGRRRRRAHRHRSTQRAAMVRWRDDRRQVLQLPSRALVFPKGDYIAHIFADPQDPAANYEALAVSTQHVTATDTLDLACDLPVERRSTSNLPTPTPRLPHPAVVRQHVAGDLLPAEY